ncbi:MAG: hypothetical protein V1688_00180 [bacterium]
MLNYKKIKILIFLTILFSVSLTPVFAAPIPIKELIKGDRAITAERAGYTTAVTGITELRATYLKAVLSFLGVVFLGLIIYGGFVWMDARGNSEEVEKAKSIIINASIGLCIILASYAISSYIISRLAAIAG